MNSKKIAAFAVAATLALATQAQAGSVNVAGNATQNGDGSITLTNGGYYQAGAAWLASPYSTGQSWAETFSFSLVNNNGGTMADGIAFAIQNRGNNVVGAAGGNIGYYGLGAIGSVVQTWGNNTVGLNLDGIPYDTAQNPFETMGNNSVVTGTETVTYDAANHTLGLTADIDGFSFSQLASVDLTQLFGSSVYLGFTGGTGGATAVQTITSFTTPVPEAGTLSMMAAGLALVGVMSRRRKQSHAA